MGKYWSDDEKVRLREAWEAWDGGAMAFDRAMADELDRTVGSISQKRRNLDLLATQPGEWSDVEDERLSEAWEAYVADLERGTVRAFDERLAAEMDRTLDSITQRRAKLDLQLPQGGAQSQEAPPGSAFRHGIQEELKELDLRDYYHDEANDRYIFSIDGKQLPLPGEVWRWMCREYPREGANKTAQEVATELALPVGVVQRLFRLAKHYKTSLPFSHEEIAEKSPEELAEQMVATKSREVVALYRREIERDWKKKARDILKWRYSEERFIEQAAAIVQGQRAPAVVEKSYSDRNDSDQGTEWVAHAPSTDEHVGLHVWADETFSDSHWDTEISTGKIRLLADRTVAWVRAQPGRCVRIHRTFLGDLLHASKGQTEHGTDMDLDTRFPKVWAGLYQAVKYTIETLRRAADVVEVSFVPGNHDGSEAIFKLMYGLADYYEDADDVEIPVHPQRYAAFRVGETLHVLDHGYRVGTLSWKARAQAETVARETNPAAFHGAEWIVTYLGHLHKREEAPQGGHHRILRLPAFCPTDDYATGLRFAGRPAALLFRLDAKGRIVGERTVYGDVLSAPLCNTYGLVRK